MKVCKVFFLKTLDVTEKMIRVALQKDERSETGALSPDKRGRQAPANKTSAEKIAQVHEHIALLPVVPPHLCRRDSSKHYIEGDLTLAIIYDKYLEWTTSQDIDPVKKAIYKREMDSLNIGIHQPRKDQCWCAGYHRLELDEQEEGKEKFDYHRKMVNEVNIEKKKDIREAKEFKDTQTLFFDLEAVLYSPFILGKTVFYMRRLATLNLTVNEMKNKTGKDRMQNLP